MKEITKTNQKGTKWRASRTTTMKKKAKNTTATRMKTESCRPVKALEDPVNQERNGRGSYLLYRRANGNKCFKSYCITIIPTATVSFPIAIQKTPPLAHGVRLSFPPTFIHVKFVSCYFLTKLVDFFWFLSSSSDATAQL